MPSTFDLTPYQVMRRSGATPRQTLLQCIRDGHERIEVWWMLREVFSFEQALCKAAWLEAHGKAILPEYAERLNKAEALCALPRDGKEQ